MKRLASLFVVLTALTSAHGGAAEGKWTPQQLTQLDPAWLREAGLQVPASRLWDPATGTGLLSATISVGGCSAGLISNTGLFITNHHCLYPLLQQHSTPANDIITNGFLARSREAELPSKSLRATIPRRFTDVTAEITSSAKAGASDADRYRAIERKQKEIVARCEKGGSVNCRVAAFDGGVSYSLIETTEIQDVRLVYAPPDAVGDYGGEVDNWMWPRHAGDFAIGRLYVSSDGKSVPYASTNIPYAPPFHFPVAKTPLREGDSVMVLGYPGTTYRALTAAEMRERRDRFFPRRNELFGEWISILEESTKRDPAGAIAVAADIKNLRNRRKNAEGQVAGFQRGSLLEKQIAAEERVIRWAGTRRDMTAALAARKGLAAMIAEGEKTWERDFLLSQISMINQPLGGAAAGTPVGPKSLYFGSSIALSAMQRPVKDVDRYPELMDRELPKLRDRMEREQKNFYAPAERQLMASFVRHARKLPGGSRIATIDRAFEHAIDDQTILETIDHLISASRIFNGAERLKMLTESEKELRARKDPLVDLGFALAGELQALRADQERSQGMIYRLRPLWRRAVMEEAGRPLAPDANSTLRVSFGRVRGYAPRDGVVYKPMTSLAGLLAKQTGQYPFAMTLKVLRAAEECRKDKAGCRSAGAVRWFDEAIDDVPVDFLADADTTGGNSGSPTLNARGEVVGVNFDRVWENVANDFGYDETIARNISVDVRYFLWMLDRVDGGTELLKELGF